MNVNGGYQLVDFKNISISSTSAEGVTVKGVYETIEGSYRKLLVGSNIVIDDVELNNVVITPINGENQYEVELYGKNYTITSDDLITVATE